MSKRVLILLLTLMMLSLLFLSATACARQSENNGENGSNNGSNNASDNESIAAVKAYEPFSGWLSITATYGDVFGKYIESQEWSHREEDGNAFVEISGRLTGTGERVNFTFEVADGTVIPSAGFLEGFTIESSSDTLAVMMSMFIAYADGFEHYMDMAAVVEDESEMLFGLWAYFWGGPVPFFEETGYIEFKPDGIIVIPDRNETATWSLSGNELTIISSDAAIYVFHIELWDDVIRITDDEETTIAYIFY